MFEVSSKTVYENIQVKIYLKNYFLELEHNPESLVYLQSQQQG